MDTAIFSALADQNRLQILELLRSGPLTVGEIAEQIGMRQPHASKNLRILNEARLVEVHAQANKRYYKLRPEPFKEMQHWLEAYAQVWNEKLDRLDDYLKKMQGGNENDKC